MRNSTTVLFQAIILINMARSWSVLKKFPSIVNLLIALILVLFLGGTAYCQQASIGRSSELSDSYFIQNEEQITGNIQRKITIEEESINESQSVISIFSDGQEVFSSRRINHNLRISGVWKYVHSSDDPKVDKLMINLPCSVMFSSDGEAFTIETKKIRFIPKGGTFVGILRGFEQTQNGVTPNVAANNLEMEIAIQKGKNSNNYISYIRKR
ncbi:hypothetical protein [Dyadobacter sp. SG02]|uniref:hypothetical protein n=1 Tax=Dyadobacter sp. SG02 TaxID=1855291 RepID=UPI00115F7AA4|nr:hypothetical protein [Dyadobacter sp. SG02]